MTKTLHDQEERRLFYVAMTRARDSLTIYAKQGTGKDKTPPGFMRELLKHPALGSWLVQRAAARVPDRHVCRGGGPAARIRLAYG